MRPLYRFSSPVDAIQPFPWSNISAFCLLFNPAYAPVVYLSSHNRGDHKPHGPAYGHYKKGYDYHPGWHKKHYKHGHHYRDRYRYREVHKVPHHYDRHAPRRGTIIGFNVREPGFKFAIVVKDRR